MKSHLFQRCAGLLLILLASAGAVIAAPPANDNFANRINLGNTLPTSATGTNVDATEQTGEPLPISGLSTVWWRWTAAAAGPVEVNTLGSLDGADPLDTVLAVYTGTVLTSLVQVAVNDESAAGYTSLVRFTAVAGTTYVIQVLGWEGAEGSVQLNIKSGPPLPANDAFASAITLTTGTPSAGTTDGATLQPSEAGPVGIYSGDYFGSSWWAWTAPSAGWYRLTVVGASYDQVASIWTGTVVSALTPVHSDEGSSSGPSSRAELFFQATSGTRYAIAVGNSYVADGRPVTLTMNAAVPPVYNASFTVSPGAVNVTSAPATVNAVFRMVSTEPFSSGLVTLSTNFAELRSISFSDAERTSGSSTDGTYTVPVLLPRYIAPGAYRISRISIQGDSFYETGELSPVPFAPGASRAFSVANTGSVDVEGPVITSVSVAPAVVDVTTGPKTVSFTLQISDPLSGFSSGNLILEKLLAGGGTQYLTGIDFHSTQRTAGTAQNGTYTVSLTIPSSALGDYLLRIDGVQDGAGNYAESTNSTDPAFPGPFTGTVLVNRTAVHVLNSFTLSPPSVNVTTADVNVTATCSITSNSGEFSYGYLSLQHPTANVRFGVPIYSTNRTAGTSTSGTYAVTLPVPRYLTPGLYAAELYLGGTLGDASRYGAGEFAFPAGSVTALTVTNTGAVDIVGPVIAFVSAIPNSIPSGSGTPLVVRVRVTDALVGVDYVSIRLRGSEISYSLFDAVRISGSELDGVWELSSALSTDIPVGIYSIEISAADKLSNYSTFTTDPGIAAQSVTITAAVSAYNAWTTANSLTGSDALADADPDKDGTGNFMEFAMGMDPRSRPANPAGAFAAGLPAVSFTGSGPSRRLTLSFWVPDDLLDGNSQKLTYLAQFSSDGTTWTDVPQTSFNVGETMLATPGGVRRFCIVIDPATYSASQPRFGRIRVSYNP